MRQPYYYSHIYVCEEIYFRGQDGAIFQMLEETKLMPTESSLWFRLSFAKWLFPAYRNYCITISIVIR